LSLKIFFRGTKSVKVRRARDSKHAAEPSAVAPDSNNNLSNKRLTRVKS